MAPKSSEDIRSKDVLLPSASTSAVNMAAPSRSRQSQTARKSAGTTAPQKMTHVVGSSTSASRPPRQSARKSSGSKPPKPMTAGASLQSVKMPIRIAHQKVGNSFTPYNRPLDDPSGSGGSEDSLARSSSSGQRQRASQTARKSTTPRSRLEELDQTSSPHIPPLPADPGPLILCDLCPFPLQAPYTGVDLNQPIRDIMTICQHRFHYACYMRFLTTAPIGSRGSCPKCGGNLLTDHRYWVNVTTNAGNQCYTDMTKEVEERFAAVRLARQQILFDFLNSGNLNLAAPLLTGPYAVDVNYRTPSGGFTPLHVCATYNNVAGINLLLSHGADQHQKSDEGFMAIDYANANNALAAVTQLT